MVQEGCQAYTVPDAGDAAGFYGAICLHYTVSARAYLSAWNKEQYKPVLSHTDYVEGMCYVRMLVGWFLFDSAGT